MRVAGAELYVQSVHVCMYACTYIASWYFLSFLAIFTSPLCLCSSSASPLIPSLCSCAFFYFQLLWPLCTWMRKKSPSRLVLSAFSRHIYLDCVLLTHYSSFLGIHVHNNRFISCVCFFFFFSFFSFRNLCLFPANTLRWRQLVPVGATFPCMLIYCHNLIQCIV